MEEAAFLAAVQGVVRRVHVQHDPLRLLPVPVQEQVHQHRLYADESLAMELHETAYALDSTTIDLCLSMFPWANFRKTKTAVKMHTLLDLRGSIPSFIHVSDGKLHDINVLDLLVPEPGSTYVMDRAYVDFQRLHALHQAGAFFVTRTKKNFRARRLYSAPTNRAFGVIADQTVALDGVRTKLYTPTTCGVSATKTCNFNKT